MPVENLDQSFYVDIRSHNARRLLRERTYEPDVIELIRQHIRPDRDFIDVGANVGFVSIFAATFLNEGKRVLAVEPTPRALELLNRNTSLHNLSEKILIENVVATERRVDAIPMFVLEGKEEYSSVEGIRHPEVNGETPTEIKVKGCPIDELVTTHGLEPGFIKVDTEGHEASVFAGAERTLREHAPVIISEISDRLLSKHGGSQSIIETLKSYGYQVYDAKSPNSAPRFPFEGEIFAIKP